MDPNQLEVSANEPSLGGVIFNLWWHLQKSESKIIWNTFPDFAAALLFAKKLARLHNSFFPQISSITWGSSYGALQE